MTNSIPTPSNFICPITCDIMENPVLLVEDGHSYEKDALESWLKEHNTSPLTNKVLETKMFVVNYNLKSTIEEFCQEQNKSKLKLDFRSFTLHSGRSHKKEWENYPKLKIIISLLGAANVGKSCLAGNIEYGQPQLNHRSRTTLAVDISFFYINLLFEDKYVVIVQINDCPGNDRFEAVDDRHFRSCHGAVLMVDTTDMDSFERLQTYWYKRLHEKSSFDSIESVLACNKIDLLEKNYDSTYREQFFKQADTFVSNYQMPIFNISALRGDNVQAMFHQLVLSILQNQSLVKHLKESQIQTEQRTATQNAPIQLTVPSETLKGSDKKSCSC